MLEELDVVTRTYDLILWLVPHIAKFPRSHRFVLGERMETTAYDVFDGLIEAKYTRERHGILDRVNIRLERLRFQVRMAKDFRFLSLRQYHFAAEAINEVGKLVGGWRKKA